MKRDLIELEDIKPTKCTLPCKYMEKRYIVSYCDEDQGIVDIDTISSRHSLWTYSPDYEKPDKCTVEADIVVPHDYEKEAKTYVKKQKGCRITDVHRHPDDDPDWMPGSHLHILCENVGSKKMRGLVERLLDKLT